MSRDTDGKRPKRGYKMSAEAIEKRNEARRRNNIAKYGEDYAWFSPETVEKLRKAQTGMRYGRQVLQNMSEAAYKRERMKEPNRPSLEGRAKISYARKERPPVSKERREAQSYKMKIWWEKKKKAEAQAKAQ